MVLNKLNEYGFEIFKHHELSDEQHVFFCSEMVMFVYKEEHSIGISFQATTKPDIAAKNILVLSEIDEIRIDIMESFIYSTDNKLINGDEAYELIEDAIKNKAVEEYKKHATYEYLLNNVDCFEC